MRNSNNNNNKLSYLLSRAGSLLISVEIFMSLLFFLFEDFGEILYSGDLDEIISSNFEITAIFWLIHTILLVLCYFFLAMENEKPIMWKTLYGITIVVIFLTIVEKSILIPIIFESRFVIPSIIIPGIIGVISQQLICMGCGGFLALLVRD